MNVGQHGLGVGRSVVLADNSFTFTCDQDGNVEQKTYPRPGQDPYAGQSIPITNVSTSSHTPTDAPYDAATGVVTFQINSHGFSNGDYIKIDDDSLITLVILMATLFRRHIHALVMIIHLVVGCRLLT